MAYLPKRGYMPRNLSGLGGAESCGADQIWDPNAEFYGIKGQCMPRKNYTAAQIAALQQQAASSSGSTAGNILGALIGGLLAPKPVAPVVAPAPSSGISTGTAVALGVGALALIFIATR